MQRGKKMKKRMECKTSNEAIRLLFAFCQNLQVVISPYLINNRADQFERPAVAGVAGRRDEIDAPLFQKRPCGFDFLGNQRVVDSD